MRDFPKPPLWTVAVTSVMAVLNAGCATTTQSSASASSSVVDRPTTTAVAMEACPPGTEGPVERNLKVSFEQRMYRLANGALCSPLAAGSVTQTTPALDARLAGHQGR